MKSVMKHNFSNVPQVNIQRSKFNRSHGYKTTLDAGLIIPVFCDEALPGDTFNLKMSALARMSTPIYPIMDNLYFDTHFFAVPIRLVWDNFQKFMGEQDNPGDSTDYLVPTMVAPATVGHVRGSLSDYLGIPTGIADLEHSSLFHRAYNLIWNQWYRDENLQDSVTVDKDDGPDSFADYAIKNRGKRHDYFTSCLPWPQKGDAVDMPLGGTAPIVGNTQDTQVFTGLDATTRNLQIQSDDELAATGYVGALSNLKFTADASKIGLSADLDNSTGSATINALRQAFQIQRLLEKDARGGTRYTEIVKSHFGVTSPDSRLQRAEYLGGGTQAINVTPVLQTGSNDISGQPVQQNGIGNTGAYSVTSINNHGFTKSFTEHTLILGLVSVRADLTYQQGLNRMFSRQTRYDFYWPSLAQIGEQAVLNKEIYAQNDANDDLVFGYQERYAEYRYKPSLITGAFRSTDSFPLDAWHLAQEFTSLPSLGEVFITEMPPMDRIIATTGEPDFIWDSYFKMNCIRPMPLYGVPGMIDHF